MTVWNLRIPTIFSRWPDAGRFLDDLQNAQGVFVRSLEPLDWVTVVLPDFVNPFSLFGVLEIDEEELGQFLSPTGVLDLPRLDTALSWATLRIGADLVHPTTRGAGVHIAFVDSGFSSHLEFAGADLRNITRVSDPLITNNNDVFGHGTLVMGMSAARGSSLLGVAPGAGYSMIKASTDDGLFGSTWITSAFLMADSFGADIISLSLGFSSPHQPLTDAIRSFTNRGGLVVAAAGNNGVDANHTPTFPANLPEVISVGASNFANKVSIPFNCTSSAGSAWGSWPNAPDCVAPGDQVNSTNNASGYSVTCGTSLSTPVVAGALALCMSGRPDLWNVSGTLVDPKYGFSLPARTVRARELLRDTSIDLGDSRDREGYGMAHALGLLSAVIPSPNGNGNGGTMSSGSNLWLPIGLVGAGAVGLVLAMSGGRS